MGSNEEGRKRKRWILLAPGNQLLPACHWLAHLHNHWRDDDDGDDYDDDDDGDNVHKDVDDDVEDDVNDDDNGDDRKHKESFWVQVNAKNIGKLKEEKNENILVFNFSTGKT